MKTVILKAKQPTALTWHYSPNRPGIRYEFSLDNDCRCEVPVEFWEGIRDSLFDQREKIRYHEFFNPL